MTSEQFVFWLQGYLEIGNPDSISKEQLGIIKDHLNLVFKHEIDPKLNEGKTEEEISVLNQLHNPINPINTKPILRC